MRWKSMLLLLALCAPTIATAQSQSEAHELSAFEARESHRPAYNPEAPSKFKESDHVFVQSALAVDFTYRKATVTLPLFRGLDPEGESVYYILTDASDFEFAKALGINYAPKLRKAAGSPGAQTATIKDGLITFKGNVDFSPVYKVVPGSPDPFPPAVADPGAVADAQWSSIVVLPSGIVINAQVVHNKTGSHDRLKDIDLKHRTVTLSVLDGAQGGKQYFYHLVTDVSASLPAVLEKGVFAPRLAMLPTFGKSEPTDDSALLGFSPNVNGISKLDSGQEQGFVASLSNGGIDPINVFPLGPNNQDSSESNNYSPLWDAHISLWTPKAIQEGKVHRILSMAEQKQLIADGYLTSATGDASSPTNAFVGGLHPSGAIINCPVIAHPELPAR
ncbi:MAG: hypothetical protein WA772_07205 [Candidatus Acidiferrales bacterium]